MRSHTLFPMLALAFLLTASISFMADADDAPDDMPFGLSDRFWYSRSGAELSASQLDPSVERSFLEDGDADKEFIVQFQPPLDEEDYRALDDAGLSVIGSMSALPAVFVRGDLEAIERISRYQGLFWIEHNTVMEYDMDGTTNVINATKAWDSVIVDEAGREYPYIQGEGITAVVLDSGIDAGHPDLDYGEKVIKNYKSDSDLGWIEMENSDTSSGHGTHCAGTVAGNGDASGGARKGVAPRTKLIGLSTGEAVAILNALGALEWVYEHSRPGHTYEWEDPIRVVSNSWGPSPGDYNPEDSISIISQKITFENNVVIVFAASNSGGDGSDIQTNPYGNVPSNICVAAFSHDGSGVASFSSRGQDGILTTYPDVGAPGVSIWSTAARRTLISLMTKQNQPLSEIDPYYFAISGTSMATPHIAGVVSLMLSAYPDLRMSDVYQDAEAEKMSDWNGGTGWTNDTRNRVHEVELILEATARYTAPSDEGAPLAENNIPQNHSIGWNGAPFDFAQGYGLVQVDKAIGLTLTLRELRTRDFNGDGYPDHPDATVQDALLQYERTMKRSSVEIETSTIYAAWSGEWSRFSNQTNQMIPMNHDTSKLVTIPEGVAEIELTMTFDPLSAERMSAVALYANIDMDGDGSPDWTQSGSPLASSRIDVIPVAESDWGSTWSVNVEGRGIDWELGTRLRDTQYKEVRSEFTISLNATLSPGQHELRIGDIAAKNAKWKPVGNVGTGSTLSFERDVYDLGEVGPLAPAGGGERGAPPFSWLLLLVLAAAIGIGAFLYIRSRKRSSRVRTAEVVEP